MKSIFSKILLILFIFTHTLFADGTNIPITVSNPTVNESAGTVTFTITLDKAPISIFGMTVDYQTRDGSASAGSDYEEKTGGMLDFLYFSEGTTSRDLTLDIYDDAIYEGNEGFYLDVTTSASGYQPSATGAATIVDDDIAQQPLTIYLHNQEIDETDDNNSKVTFTARLNKDAPAGGVTVSYETSDGSAKAGEDYVAKSGDIFIAEGERDGFIEVDIIGDTIIEKPDNENFNLKLTNVTVVDSIEKGEAICTIYDNDFYPEINFEQVEYSIVEGNSSQKMIDITFLFDEGVQDGASFHYETWDDTAEDESKDNDYIYKEGDVTLTSGDRSYTIQIPINGDTKIENDEYFFVGISNLNKLDWGNEGEVKVKIINDDGAYPTLSFESNSYEVIEGNSSTRTIEFKLNLDKPALANSSFDYYTANSTATIADNDYMEINRTTHTFNGGETTFTIPVTINGDTDFENDEQFYLKIDNEINLTISGTQSPLGRILNDDIEEFPFSCNEESFISFNTESAATAGSSKFNTILLADGTLQSSDIINSVNGVNSIGYNVKDNFVWGYNLNENRVIRIDRNKNGRLYDIAGLEERFYVAVDVDKNGILYLFSRGDSNERRKIARVDLNTLTLLPEVELSQEINTADMAFNPKDGLLYFIQKDTDTLYKITISSNIGTVSPVGSMGIGTVDPIINFFDRDGNFYFNKDLTSIYKVDVINSSTATPFSTLDSNLRNGDGARCANAPVTPPIDENEPFICDESMYLSSSIKRGTGETGKMWLHKIDTSKNPFDFIPVDEEGESKLYNALAYSDAGDENSTDYIFGLYKDELVKMGRAGKVISLGVIDSLSELLNNKQFFAGAAYGGYYYISGPGVDYNKIFKIDLSDKSVTEIVLDQAISLLDFSFTPDGKYLHGIIDGGELVKIDVATGTVTKIGTAHSGYQFDSTFSDKNGRFFANDSKGNGFFEFDLTTGEKNFLSASQPASFNDGANCLKAELLFTDYGDAPISYGPAWHQISNDIYLGTKVDHDIGSYDTVNADGDDISGVDDDDGVTLVDGSDINGTYFEPNKTHQLKVTLSKEAYLNIWIDTNINGHFNDASDLLYSSNVKLSAGTHTISFTLPDGLTTNTLTYLRARVSSNSAKNPTGFMIDGEVEDYAIKFGTKFQGVPGTFNVERVGSHTLPINSDERNAWYTQIVGLDFDYHVVFYDENMTQEKELKNVPIKIELIDLDKVEGNNSIAPAHYDYFFASSTHKSRVLVTKPMYDEDLKDTIATKRAIFRVSYPAHEDGTVKEQNCDASLTAEECYNLAITSAHEEKIALAKDEFSIRPEMIYVNIKDKKSTILNSKNDTTVSLASGYEYNLTVTATQYTSDNPAKGYTIEANSSIELNATGLTCRDTSDINETIEFTDGLFQDLSFKHNNVGRYLLKIEDDKSWTEVDQNSSVLGCIPNSGERVANAEGKVGCDIVVDKFDSELLFYPDHFAVNLTMQNLPQSGHPDFIYMMELNATNDNVAIAFDGNITAQTEDNQTTTNFTTGCVATNLLLDLNATTVSVEGTNQRIFTTDNITPVDFSRVIRFNHETNSTQFEVNNTLPSISSSIAIGSNRFLDENNGTMSLDMRYNLNKNLMQPINPIEVTFNSIDVSSTDANSSAYEVPNHIPTGTRAFVNNVKNFYFARVVSDLNNYPRVNMNISPLVRTPLNVDIFCGTTIANYCRDRRVITNSNLSGTTREQNGWYLSKNHNGNLDGNVTGLIDNPNNVTITPDPTPVGVDDITLTNGENGLVNTVFDNCNAKSVTVTIETNPVLTFEPSEYTVNCTDVNASQWAGIGQTGNVLTVKPKVDKTGKMEW